MYSCNIKKSAIMAMLCLCMALPLSCSKTDPAASVTTTTSPPSATSTFEPTTTEETTETFPAPSTAATTTETTAETTTTVATTSADATTKTTSTAAQTTEPSLSDQIHFDAFVVDTHCDTLLDIDNEETWLPVISLGQNTSFMIDIPKLMAGGVDVQVFAAYTSGYALDGGGQDFAKANCRLLSIINGLKWTVSKNSKTIRQIYSISQVDQIDLEARIGAISGIEGAYSLNEDTGLELLLQYYDLGVRMISLTWNWSNALGEGINNQYRDGTPSSGGLTDLGRSVIGKMNQLGMVVDVSHLSEETFWDVAETSSSPIVASHSGVRHLCEHVRNLKDDQIRAIADSGGVVHVVYHRPFLSADADRATIGTLVDHIDYIVDLVGIDHVGLGSDFDGGKMPKNLTDASMLPNLTRELVNRGYSEEEINKILGGNSVRVFTAIWNKRTTSFNSSHSPNIEFSISMGEIISSPAPTLTATITADEGYTLDPASINAIIDGKICTPEYDVATDTASVTTTDPLDDQFHVMTYTAANTSGEIARKAVIFYIQS